MQTYLECYPCFVRQVLDGAKAAGMDTAQQHALLQRALGDIARHDIAMPPSELSSHLQALARQASGIADPYREAKAASTRAALEMVPRLSRMICEAEDPLEAAVRLSIAGNIMDLGVLQAFDLEATVERVLAEPFAINHLPALRQALAHSRHLLFLGDNAGETVFDRLLIETVGLPTTYVVKAGPAVNDTTREDAIAAGLDRVAEIVDNGNDGLGTLLHHCSAEFVRRFESAELIIAKGQANFECLDGLGAPVFYLLQAKCRVIAQHLNVPQFGIVLKHEQAGDGRVRQSAMAVGVTVREGDLSDV